MADRLARGRTFDLGYTDACDFMFTTVTTDETDTWKVYLYAYAHRRRAQDAGADEQDARVQVRGALRTLFEGDRKRC